MPVIVLNSFNAVRHTPALLIGMGKSFLGNRWQLIRSIILPAASLVIFAGLRLGAAAGFIGAILAELLISDIITYSQSIADYRKIYAAIASIIAFSVLFIEFLEWLEIHFFDLRQMARPPRSQVWQILSSKRVHDDQHRCSHNKSSNCRKAGRCGSG